MVSPDFIDEKARALRESGTLNSGARHMRDGLFQASEFFDPRDIVQVRYEMLRRVREEGVSVTEASSSFGVSRPTYYLAQTVFAREGLHGLLPRKRGPRGGHKLTADVMAWVVAEREKAPSLSSAALTQLVGERFSVRVHRRSIERALARLGEKRR